MAKHSAETNILSARWINERTRNVLTQVEEALDHIIDEGLLSSGYFPLEEPVSSALLRRLSPEQAEALVNMEADPESQRELRRRISDLDVASFLVGDEGQY